MQKLNEVTLERMIENAIKDLDGATARTLNADQERLTNSCANLEFTDSTAPPFARKIEPPPLYGLSPVFIQEKL